MYFMNKWLVTSGCSFSDNIDKRWPHFLSEKLDFRLINYGYGSAGNDHICHSTIFAINQLLSKNIKTSNITVVVMWSGIERQGHFISKKETHDFDKLINTQFINPCNFLMMKELPIDSGRFIPINRDIEAGWLLGSPNCSWENENIKQYKKLHFQNFHTYESCLFNSLNYFLQLQWFCECKNIKLINLTFTELFQNRTQYQTTQHLFDMINFDKWKFWDNTKGLYEYTRDNKLMFYSDDFHPLPESHKHYVDNFLIENIHE